MADARSGAPKDGAASHDCKRTRAFRLPGSSARLTFPQSRLRASYNTRGLSVPAPSRAPTPASPTELRRGLSSSRTGNPRNASGERAGDVGSPGPCPPVIAIVWHSSAQGEGVELPDGGDLDGREISSGVLAQESLVFAVQARRAIERAEPPVER